MTPARRLLACCLLSTLALPGCASSRSQVSLKSWQGDLQTYVAESGNGDMNALRSVQAAPGFPGFRVFSNDRAEDSDDIAGVLVGATEAGGRLWYLYLVGVMEREQVQNIFALAVSKEGLKYTWRMGPADGAEFARYTQRLEVAWRAAHPEIGQAPRGALQFPAATDSFEWLARGDMVSVRETGSGAEWHVDLVAAGESAER